MVVAYTGSREGAIVLSQSKPNDGSMYTVAQNTKGKALIKLVGKKVDVKGTVKASGTEKVIAVSSYTEAK